MPRQIPASGVTDMVRGRGQGPCVALLYDSEQSLFPRELLVDLMRGMGWQVLDLRFFGRTLPRGLVPDGVFTSLPLGEPQVEALQALGCPIVRLGVIPAAGDHLIPAVVEDHAAAGRLAAEHFAERRFRHVGFVGFGEVKGNRTMYEAMRDRASELGCECHLLKHRALTSEEKALTTSELRRLRREELTQWLREVPTPIGMLAWSDNMGGRICVAASQAGLMIPSDVAVLGFGNTSDCECTPVRLSSIDPGYLQQSESAVRLMQQLLEGAPVPEKTVWVPPVGIEVRESTDALAVMDPNVARALRYMWDNLEIDLGTADVARAVGLKRRALERAFRKGLDSTIRDELCRRRIEQLKLLLRTTDWPIADLAPRVGFRSPQYLSNTFRRTVGMSPKQYRLRSQA